MHLLAFDATTPVMSLALQMPTGEVRMCEGGTNFEGGTHSLHLLPAIDKILGQSALKVGDLSGIVVANGPGSFTGLRIALATAKALAHPFLLPIYAVSTLRGLSFHGVGFKGYTLSILDARRQQVYGALYHGETEVWPEATYAVSDLIAELPALLGPNGRVMLVGDGAVVHGKSIQQALGHGCVILPEPALLNDARGVLWAHQLGHSKPYAYNTLIANYLRISQAEREREAGVNHAAPKML